MREEALHWLKAAEDDLAMAQAAYQQGQFWATAFHSQQAAEKAAKALAAASGGFEKTHASAQILLGLKEGGLEVPAELISQARRLDVHYAASRYPNAVGVAPSELYDESIAKELLGWATEILNFAKSRLT